MSTNHPGAAGFALTCPSCGGPCFENEVNEFYLYEEEDCPKCGTPVTIRLDADKTLMAVTQASLEIEDES